MKPKALFLSTGNSARSQMAEGYLRHVAGDRFEAMSAGIEPKELNPLAVVAMREIGIDISGQKPKNVVSLLGQHVPYVITVCDDARERCPIFPGTWKFLRWSFEDPAAAVGTEEERLGVFAGSGTRSSATSEQATASGGGRRQREPAGLLNRNVAARSLAAHQQPSHGTVSAANYLVTRLRPCNLMEASAAEACRTRSSGFFSEVMLTMDPQQEPPPEHMSCGERTFISSGP